MRRFLINFLINLFYLCNQQRLLEVTMIYFGILPMILCVMMSLLGRGTSGQDYFPNVTYNDLVDMKAECGYYDNCQVKRYYDNIRYVNCHCGDFCSLYDTCCVNSKHRDQFPIERKPYSCLKTYGIEENYNYKYFMVDSCDPSWNGDDLTEKYCTGDPEELDNLMMVVPVTSSKSRITYKNHYCAMCNNETNDEDLIYWLMLLGSDSQEFNVTEFPEIHYDSISRRWNYVNETSGEKSLVTITIRRSTNMIYNCYENVISKCAEDWNDTEVEAKCKAYMAMVFFFPKDGYMKKYRNPHCALCNHEKLEEMECTWDFRIVERDFASNTFFVRLFSMYDKTSKCDDEMVYDTLAKKCRKVFKG